jgi:SAM-dependent methyltransferase
METNFVEVTETAGDDVSREQIQRLCNRYYWAGEFCVNRDVLEVACGTGPGLGYLAGLAKTVTAGDYSQDIVDIARRHYGNRFEINQFDAQQMPFAGATFDAIIIFEAIYYIPSAERFLREVRRILRPGGVLLIVTANKDLYDFNPSPHSYKYYGVVELAHLLHSQGLSAEFFGGTRVDQASLVQRTLRPIKKIVVSLGLMPRTMAGKRLLKRLVFGAMEKMPAEISESLRPYEPPCKIQDDKPDTIHKVIYCAATMPLR